MDAASTVNYATRIAAEDSGLHCPRCEYNLTGLAVPRCPECGTNFDWDAVRREGGGTPHIAFEQAAGRRKFPAFVKTWATVLFAPWVFARQAVRRIGTRDALLFAFICFASTALGFASNMPLDFWATWLCTAAVYVALQTVWLSLLDWPGWRRPLATLRFWLLVTCYTSAVIATEFVRGPPAIFLEDLMELASGNRPDTWFSEMYRLSGEAVIGWTQIALWLASLGACYAARLRRAHHPASLIWPVTIFVAVSLLFLYAATLQFVGKFFSEIF